MKHILIKHIAIFFLLGWSFISYAQTDTFKIGYVNMQHLITSSLQFAKANQIILAEFEDKTEEVLSLEKKFKASIEKFKKQQETLSEADIQTRLQILRAEEKILQEKATALKERLEQRKQEESDKVRAVTNEAISIIAKIHKFDLILYQNVAYVSQKTNITPLVKVQLRALFK